MPELAPDIVEQEHGDTFDNVIPSAGDTKMRVVGLGGSAGGLAALQAFFGAMPPDTGMAFVVIMHLSREHESILAELLQRLTAMPVQQVRTRLVIQPDHVYVIPPGKHLLSMSDGHLRARPTLEPERRASAWPWTYSFRTLADTHGAHSAAGIVLSGADGDGGHRPQAHQGARRPDHRARTRTRRSKTACPALPSPRT